MLSLRCCIFFFFWVDEGWIVFVCFGFIIFMGLGLWSCMSVN